MSCPEFEETIVSPEETKVSPEETKVSLHRGIGVELGPITKHNIGLLRQLAKSIFPLHHDGYYKNAASAGDLARYVYYNDTVVGALVCRIVIRLKDWSKMLYIVSLGCLKPYRRFGVDTKLLQYALEYGRANGTFKKIFLHVQVNNDEALAFYTKYGFEILKTNESYYSDITPRGTLVLERSF